MMFSRVGRSIAQFSRSRNALSGGNGGRSQILVIPNTTTPRFFHSLQKKKKISTGEKVALIIIAPPAFYGLFLFERSLRSEYDRKDQRMRRAMGKMKKLTEEMPKYEWWKIEDDDEKEN